nr:unnamed protein product [Callosobruchus chinensis]
MQDAISSKVKLEITLRPKKEKNALRPSQNTDSVADSPTLMKICHEMTDPPVSDGSEGVEDTVLSFSDKSQQTSKIRNEKLTLHFIGSTFGVSSSALLGLKLLSAPEVPDSVSTSMSFFSHFFLSSLYLPLE